MGRNTYCISIHVHQSRFLVHGRPGDRADRDSVWNEERGAHCDDGVCFCFGIRRWSVGEFGCFRVLYYEADVS